MVQYIITPWAHPSELLAVRAAFYPHKLKEQKDVKRRGPERGRDGNGDVDVGVDVSGEDTEEEEEEEEEKEQKNDEDDNDADDDDGTTAAARQATGRVAVWVKRGNCPHLVDVTAALVACRLDLTSTQPGTATRTGTGTGGRRPAAAVVSAGTMRLALATAFARFVTGLLDGYQDKSRKMSMFSVAKSIGLPDSFVELRHQIIHEELPPLRALRAAAERALAWIWEYYWKTLGTPEEDVVSAARNGGGGGGGGSREECRAALQDAVERVRGGHADDDDDDEEEEEEEEEETMGFRGEDIGAGVRRWGRDEILSVVPQIDFGSRTDGYLEAVRLVRRLVEGDGLNNSRTQAGPTGKDGKRDLEAVRRELEEMRERLDEPVSERMYLEVIEEKPSAKITRGAWSRWEGPWVPKPIGVV